jgi:hypothetical protein
MVAQLTKGYQCSISTRGRYFPPEEKDALLKTSPDLSKLAPNDRPLYLVLQVRIARRLPLSPSRTK